MGPAQQLAQEAEATDSASQGKAVNDIPRPNQGESTLSDSVKSGKVACSSATPYQRTVLQHWPDKFLVGDSTPVMVKEFKRPP